MRLKEQQYDALPTLRGQDRRDAWQECILALVDELSLSLTQYDLIKERYKNIADILQDPKDPRLKGISFFPQGSFSTRTVIKPAVDGEIDVDGVAWTANQPNMTASELYNALFDEIEARTRTKNGVKKKNRCTQVVYAEQDPKFHLDVTPAVNVPGNCSDKGVGKLHVPDNKAIARGEPGWKPSAPKDFAQWIDDQSQETIQLRVMRTVDEAMAEVEALPTKQQIDAFDPLRATIKLLKFHRNRYFEEHALAEFQPISVLLTTLAAKAYVNVARRSRNQALEPIDAVIAIIDEIPNCFDPSTQKEKHRVENPCFRSENFAERWNDAENGTKRVKAFKDWHQAVRQDIRLGEKAFPNRDQFVDSVVESFGTHTGRRVLNEVLDRQKRRGQVVAGHIDSDQQSNALSGLLGVQTTTKPRQSTPPLNKLG